MKIGIYYGSTTGNTKAVAESIKSALAGHDVVCSSIAGIAEEKLASYDLLILGISTWGCGDLQEDWEAFIPKLEKLDLSGRKVALFGVGDQSGWGDTFVDAMGILYEKLGERGAAIIGSWPIDGYEHVSFSVFVIGVFLCLGID